CTRTRFDFW
nr:immunoglobulin heavy chain junction region [Macaca mulatta]MOX16264.1 immunoglobulin heavy chain junction region [Macaca mulatta]